MRLLLDTVTFIQAISNSRSLSRRVTSLLDSPESIRELSSVSITEIAIKSNLGKLELSREQVVQGIEDFRVRVLNFTAAHALQLFGLPRHHHDPFDRQIIAQAVSERIPIVTSDKSFHQYKGLTVIS